MSAHFERAQLLLQQSRNADAEREALLGLGKSPDDPYGHCLLALSRAEQNKADEAIASARAAVALQPDVAYLHFVHGLVLHRLDRHKEALASAHEAIRLDPADPNHFRLLGSIHLSLRDWAAALEAAERGLALSPENVDCANLRAVALVRLGRKAEAMETVDYALQREPENPESHTNQGWNCLHRNDPKRAQEHFREALRLQPDMEPARHGMLQALKARNPIYRGMLMYSLWMSRQSDGRQWAFIIGVWLGTRLVRGMLESTPSAGWILWPILVSLYLFVYLSWTAGPMFNLLLRLDRFGRLVLSRDERTGSNWFGAGFALALAGAGAWWAGWEKGFELTVIGAALSICLAATFQRTGRARKKLGLWTLGQAAAGAMAFVPAEGLSSMAFAVFVLGFLIFQLAANAMKE